MFNGTTTNLFSSDEPIRSSVEIYYWRLIRGPARIYTYQREICPALSKHDPARIWSTDITRRCPIHGSRARFNSIIMIGFVQNEWDLTHAIIARYEQYWHNEFGRQHSDVSFLRKLSRIIEISRDDFFCILLHKKWSFPFYFIKNFKKFFFYQYIETKLEIIGIEIFEITLLAIERSCVSRSRQRSIKRKVRGDP